MWVVKRANSLFNSFCNNVAKQAVCFFGFPFFVTFSNVMSYYETTEMFMASTWLLN